MSLRIYPHTWKIATIIALFIITGAFQVVGGRIGNITFCANGQLLLIGPPRPGLFLFQFGSSRLFRWFSIRPGNWVLGLARPGGVCVCPNGNCLVGAIPAQGTFWLIGTSI